MRVKQTFNINFHMMSHCAIYNITTIPRVVLKSKLKSYLTI